MKNKNLRTILLNWEVIDKIGNIKLLKSSFIIFLTLPIVVQTIEKYNIKLEIPFNWLLLYYSTLFISLGTLIYAIFCPDIVKNFKDYEEFKKSGRGGGYLTIQLRTFLNKEIDDQNKLAKYLSDEFESAHFKNEDGVKDIINSTIWDNDKDSFWFVHDCLNYSKQFARLFCIIFYVIGFSLITLVLVEKIYTVTNYLITIN